MNIIRTLSISRRQLLAHKLRTILALLGIVVGVSAVIVMVAIGTGAQREVLGRIEQMGTNLIVVSAAEVQRSPGRLQVRGTVTTLTVQDAEAISRDVPQVAAAAPVQGRRMQVRYGGTTSGITITGTTPHYPDVRNFRVASGSFFDETDNIALRRVAVLGAGAHRVLFGGQNTSNGDGSDGGRSAVGSYPGERYPAGLNAIGETIRIGNVPFDVIGIMEPKGVDLDGVDQDNQIFIPVNTALRRVFNVAYINNIYIRAQNRDVMDEAAFRIRDMLRERHRLNIQDQPDDFTISTQLELLDAQRETTDTFTMLIGSIAGVSLFVGGIGILAIMLISVRERVNEIGLRMAVGARKKDVLIQFLLEASMLSLGGGIAGIVFGIAGSVAVGMATDWATSVSLYPLLLAFVFSFAIGLFFGVYPARKASQLDPIEALRSE
ncbi:MAG: FtsX-like permease family protein [Balneolaceae bacterium]|nr:MAG: FtsX-like permease family protein [Balneolaceae bacterium]